MVVERIDPFNPTHVGPVMIWHVQRYYAAVQFMSPGPILDAGCGVGYGSRMLAQARPDQQVIGVDNNESAIARALSRYHEPNLAFMVDDLETFSLPCRFGYVVMLEVIEHLSDPEKGLRNVASLMLPDSRLWISIPLYEEPGDNKFHKSIWEVGEFIKFVTDVGFVKRKTEFRQQRNWTGLFGWA